MTRDELRETLRRAIEVYRSLFNDPQCNQIADFHECNASWAEEALNSNDSQELRRHLGLVLRESHTCALSRKWTGLPRSVRQAEARAAAAHGMDLPTFRRHAKYQKWRRA